MRLNWDTDGLQFYRGFPLQIAHVMKALFQATRLGDSHNHFMSKLGLNSIFYQPGEEPLFCIDIYRRGSERLELLSRLNVQGISKSLYFREVKNSTEAEVILSVIQRALDALSEEQKRGIFKLVRSKPYFSVWFLFEASSLSDWDWTWEVYEALWHSRTDRYSVKRPMSEGELLAAVRRLEEELSGRDPERVLDRWHAWFATMYGAFFLRRYPGSRVVVSSTGLPVYIHWPRGPVGLRLDFISADKSNEYWLDPDLVHLRLVSGKDEAIVTYADLYYSFMGFYPDA